MSVIAGTSTKETFVAKEIGKRGKSILEDTLSYRVESEETLKENWAIMNKHMIMD